MLTMRACMTHAANNATKHVTHHVIKAEANKQACNFAQTQAEMCSAALTALKLLLKLRQNILAAV